MSVVDRIIDILRPELRANANECREFRKGCLELHARHYDMRRKHRREILELEEKLRGCQRGR